MFQLCASVGKCFKNNCESMVICVSNCCIHSSFSVALAPLPKGLLLMLKRYADHNFVLVNTLPQQLFSASFKSRTNLWILSNLARTIKCKWNIAKAAPAHPICPWSNSSTNNGAQHLASGNIRVRSLVRVSTWPEFRRQ